MAMVPCRVDDGEGDDGNDGAVEDLPERMEAADKSVDDAPRRGNEHDGGEEDS
jgi:hypothetical protein